MILNLKNLFFIHIANIHFQTSKVNSFFEEIYNLKVIHLYQPQAFTKVFDVVITVTGGGGGWWLAMRKKFVTLLIEVLASATPILNTDN